MYAHIYIDLMGHILQNKTDLQEDCIRYRCMTLHVLFFVSDAFGSAIRENKWINTCHLWVRLQKDYAPGPMLCSVFDLFICLESRMFQTFKIIEVFFVAFVPTLTMGRFFCLLLLSIYLYNSSPSAGSLYTHNPAVAKYFRWKHERNCQDFCDSISLDAGEWFSR